MHQGGLSEERVAVFDGFANARLGDLSSVEACQERRPYEI